MKGDFLRLVEEANTIASNKASGIDGVQTDPMYVSEFDDSLVNEEGDQVVPEVTLDAESVAPYFKGWLVSKLSDDSSYGEDLTNLADDFINDFTNVYGERVSVDAQTVTLTLLTDMFKEVKKEPEPQQEPETPEDEVLTEPVEADDMDNTDDTQDTEKV